MNLYPTCLAAILLAYGTPDAFAIEDGVAAPAAAVVQEAPAGGLSLLDRARAALSNARGGPEEGGKPPEQAERGERERDRRGGDGDGKETSFFGSVKGALGFGGEQKSASKLKDITEVSQVSAKQFDPDCTSIVEPFGITDNLGSLALLGAKVAVGNLAVSFNGGAQTDLKSTIRLAGKNLNWLPMNAERMLGEHQHEALAGALLDPAKKSDREVIERARGIMQKILAQVKDDTPYAFDLSVQRKGGSNAQALPGGFILIEKDLVTDRKKEGLAYFALAHEIAHVLQRHETRSVQARVTDSIDSVDGLKKLLEGARGNPASLLAYSNELMSRFVVFSKAQELQADACAVRLLDTVFTDRKRLAEIIRSYAKSLPPPEPESTARNQLEVFAENMGKMDKLHDLHPNSQERAMNLEKMLAEVAKPKK